VIEFTKDRREIFAIFAPALRLCEKSLSPKLNFGLQEGSRKDAKIRKDRKKHRRMGKGEGVPLI
jgi:hypothetical protein